jgi:hypothetical protein
MLAAISPALILTVPSVASLAVAHAQATSHLWPLFWGGVATIAVFLLAYAAFTWKVFRSRPST